MTTKHQHLTSVYLLQDASGRVYVSQYRPTESFSNHRTSAADAFVSQTGCFIEQPSHDLWLGEVVSCRIGSLTHSGLNMSAPQPLTIVAKRKFIWDYSKPIGQRMIDLRQTSNYKQLLNQSKNQ